MSVSESSPGLHFESPPLNEVVLGVQFAQPGSYKLIRAGEVWALFKDRFPIVQEQQAIPPAFETFGAPQVQGISFGMMLGPPQTRFWFLTESEAELVQFQSDRMLHNWRKVEGQDHPYPRFEKMIAEFESEVTSLNRYFELDGGLQMNQCEVTYINRIVLEPPMANPQDWLRFIAFERTNPEDFSAAFRQVIQSADNQPIGRLICEASTGTMLDGQRVLLLQITARGAPESSSIESAIELIKVGRARIGQLFLETTTDAAHSVWRRVS